ncbi:MAG: hypothetical protein IPK17_30395 [Chloroflexi bacterium]|uniref:hypothetical protein n=1 Tax=Candidatus Flexifilum breve TaxID=3140694 RepID=UPI003135413A|nr:hypothetical protein [Chloroflexota bacterium]
MVRFRRHLPGGRQICPAQGDDFLGGREPARLHERELAIADEEHRDPERYSRAIDTTESHSALNVRAASALSASAAMRIHVVLSSGAGSRQDAHQPPGAATPVA